MSGERSVKSPVARIFEIVPEGELSVVVATDTGHPIGTPLLPRDAAVECAELNAAAASGPKALARCMESWGYGF